jgi:hypothetical protein
VQTAAVFSDSLHLLASGCWVGGLFHFAFGLPLLLWHLVKAERRFVLLEPARQVASRAGKGVLSNPFLPTFESLTVGQKIYAETCAVCHGTPGRGDRCLAALPGPPPADLVVHVPLHSDRALFHFIHDGIAGTVMSPFGDQWVGEEIWHLINYIKTFTEEFP